MNKRILILYTGGTIGMVPSPLGYVPAGHFEARLHTHLSRSSASREQALPEFDVLEFDQLIDSSNAQPSDWTNIAHTICHYWRQYDGFVVLHGTDTMAYTASALSFMLQDMDKPIIFTGSQIPLELPRSDGPNNLTTSLILAAQDKLCEVALCFDGKLLRGNRSSKVHSNAFGAFDSPNYPALGQIGIKIELNHSLLLPEGKLKPVIPDIKPDNVVILPIYPGLPPKVLSALLSTQPRGLILQSYGIGNPPDGNQTFMDLLKRASDQGTSIINLSQCHRGTVVQGTYATGAWLNQMGVVPGADLTLEAAFTKLHWLLAQELNPEQIRSQMQQPLCGECE